MISFPMTAKVTPSRLKDGSEVYVGTIEEMPGVVTQANTKDGALADLVNLLGDVMDRLGLPVAGLTTEHVAAWSWQASGDSVDRGHMELQELGFSIGKAPGGFQPNLMTA